MTSLNILNHPLFGYSGSGKYVGSNAPIIEAADMGGAATFKIPSGTNPTLSFTGSIAIDTSITNFNGMLKYRDSSQVLLGISVPLADLLAATNGQIVGYSSSKLTLLNPSGSASQIVDYNSASSTTTDTTTSTTPVDTSLSVSYTPKSASNILYIEAFGAGTVSVSGAVSRAERYANYTLRRTSQTPLDLSIIANGRNLVAASTAAATSYYNVCIGATESAASTALHTYVLRHNTNVANATTSFLGATCKAFIKVWELKV